MLGRLTIRIPAVKRRFSERCSCAVRGTARQTLGAHAHAGTDEAVLPVVEEIVAATGKETARVGDATGFVLNRLQYALFHEATQLVEEGVATPDDIDSEARVTVVPATMVKGLEYDHVVVHEPADIVKAEAKGLNRLYVVLTRAVSRLSVVHAEPLPAPLT